MTTVKNKWTDLQDGVLARSLIIDFEGFQEKPPALCGVLKDGVFSQAVFDKTLWPAIEHTKTKEPGRLISVQDRQSFLDGMVESARCEGRKIIAFSKHERIELGEERVAGIYIDALSIAKNWRKTLYPEVHEEMQRLQKDNSRRKKSSKQARRDHHDHIGTRLVDYLELEGVIVPTTHGRRKATKWLKTVTTAAKMKGDKRPLSKGQKKAWTWFVNHNKRDVIGLHRLLEAILTESTQGSC